MPASAAFALGNLLLEHFSGSPPQSWPGPCVGSGIRPAQEGDPLDELDRLDAEQREAERQQREHRPADQAPASTNLVHPYARQREQRREADHRIDQRQDEEDEADDVDPDLVRFVKRPETSILTCSWRIKV